MVSQLMQQHCELLLQKEKQLKQWGLFDYMIQYEVHELAYAVINVNQEVYQLQFK
jgi:hypothetical protein